MHTHTNLLSLYNSQRKSPSPCPDFIVLDFLWSIFPSHVQDKMVKQTSSNMKTKPFHRRYFQNLKKVLFPSCLSGFPLFKLVLPLHSLAYLGCPYSLNRGKYNTGKHLDSPSIQLSLPQSTLVQFLCLLFPFRKLKHYLCPPSVTGCHFVLSQLSCIEPPQPGGNHPRSHKCKAAN